VTETISYLVADPATKAGAIIDPVLDYDPAAGRIRTHSADAIAKAIQAEGLRVEWILETHVHADHLSDAHGNASVLDLGQFIDERVIAESTGRCL
jgi:glyoxylase-like metal-dependent hydrolase (beta-lactamase superfamily II)